MHLQYLVVFIILLSITLAMFSVYSYPDITLQALRQQTVMLMADRESITIRCELNAIATTQWMLPPTGTASILNDNRIYIPALSVADEGYYTCSTLTDTASLLLIRSKLFKIIFISLSVVAY